VIFWDSSAVLPLLFDESNSDAVQELLGQDAAMLVWWGTPGECLAAIARREREGSSSRAEAERQRAALSALSASWGEVLAGEWVREHAGRLVLRHPLRAGDALQLAAALIWAESRPRHHAVATLDVRLARAARGEGFRLALPGPDA
jgi:predicted nucleic acid-binding protein